MGLLTLRHQHTCTRHSCLCEVASRVALEDCPFWAEHQFPLLPAVCLSSPRACPDSMSVVFAVAHRLARSTFSGTETEQRLFPSPVPRPPQAVVPVRCPQQQHVLDSVHFNTVP